MKAGVLFKTITSFMITSWIYAETMLIFPEVQPLTERVIQKLQIPTHNEWRVYYDLTYREDVKDQINNFLVVTGLDTQSFETNDLTKIAKLPESIQEDISSTSYVSLFDDSGLSGVLYERF